MLIKITIYLVILISTARLLSANSNCDIEGYFCIGSLYNETSFSFGDKKSCLASDTCRIKIEASLDKDLVHMYWNVTYRSPKDNNFRETLTIDIIPEYANYDQVLYLRSSKDIDSGNFKYFDCKTLSPTGKSLDWTPALVYLSSNSKINMMTETRIATSSFYATNPIAAKRDNAVINEIDLSKTKVTIIITLKRLGAVIERATSFKPFIIFGAKNSQNSPWTDNSWPKSIHLVGSTPEPFVMPTPPSFIFRTTMGNIVPEISVTDKETGEGILMTTKNLAITFQVPSPATNLFLLIIILIFI